MNYIFIHSFWSFL